MQWADRENATRLRNNALGIHPYAKRMDLATRIEHFADRPIVSTTAKGGPSCPSLRSIMGCNARALTHEIRATLPEEWTRASERFLQDRQLLQQGLPSKATAKRAHSESPIADRQLLTTVKKPVQDYRITEQETQAARGLDPAESGTTARITYAVDNERQKRQS